MCSCNDAEGGPPTDDHTVLTAGAVVTLANPVDVFAGFEQDVTVSDVGREGRARRRPPNGAVGSLPGRWIYAILDLASSFLSVTGAHDLVPSVAAFRAIHQSPCDHRGEYAFPS